MIENQSGAGLSGVRRGVFFTGSGTALNIGFLFVETMVAVRLLVPESYGTYVLIVAIVNLLLMVVDFGCKTSVIKLIAGSEHARQAAITHTALAFRLATIVAISALIWLGQDLLRLVDPSQGLLRYAGYVPLLLAVASLDELFAAILQGFQAYRNMAAAMIIRSVLRLGLTTTFLALLGLGLMGLIYSWLISFAVSATYQYLALPVSRRIGYQRRLLGEMLHFGFPLQLTRLVWFVFSRVHVFLLGALIGPVAVAFFDAASKVPDGLQRLSESYLAVYFPTVSNLIADGRRKQAERMFNYSVRLVAFVTGLGALVAVLFRDRLVTLLFSAQYAASAPAFALLMIAFQMTFISSLMGYTLVSVGKPGRTFVQNLGQAGLNLAGDLLLIPMFGFMGSAYATLGAGYIANPLTVWLLRRSEVSVSTAPYVKQAAILLLCAALSWQFPATGLVVKLATIVLFVGLSAGFATVTREDLRLALPPGLGARLFRTKESLNYHG